MPKLSLLIDGMLSGTGVRDALNGGYLSPKSLGLPLDLISGLNDWLSRYADLHYAGYADAAAIDELDHQGLVLAQSVAMHRPEDDVGYFSDARMKRLT